MPYFNQKRSFILPLFLIPFVFIFNSCKKEYGVFYTPKEDLSTSLKKIKKDVVFLNLLSSEIELFSKIDSNAYSLLKKINTKKIGENEIELYEKILGFSSRKNLMDYQNSINSKVNYLRSRYRFDEYTSIQKTALFEESLASLMEQKRSEVKVLNESLGGPCENVRISCIGSVSAQAAGMHIGCATLDLSVIGGIACHLSALGYQYIASYNCNEQAKLCRDPKILSVHSSLAITNDTLKIVRQAPVRSVPPRAINSHIFIKK